MKDNLKGVMVVGQITLNIKSMSIFLNQWIPKKQAREPNLNQNVGGFEILVNKLRLNLLRVGSGERSTYDEFSEQGSGDLV